MRELKGFTFTPLAADNELAKRFVAFEKRAPQLGVRLGFRRDCGSTFNQVGDPQPVAGTKLARYVFEGAMKNYPNPNESKLPNRFIVPLAFFRKLTWKERFYILLGYNISAEAKVFRVATAVATVATSRSSAAGARATTAAPAASAVVAGTDG